MMAGGAMDPRDLELLQQIASGVRQFKPNVGEASDAPRWLQQVERLRRLQRSGYIRMPEPQRYYGRRGYTQVGPCELTAEGHDALEAFGR
jgi:hypothetical protein